MNIRVATPMHRSAYINKNKEAHMEMQAVYDACYKEKDFAGDPGYKN